MRECRELLVFRVFVLFFVLLFYSPFPRDSKILKRYTDLSLVTAVIFIIPQVLPLPQLTPLKNLDDMLRNAMNTKVPGLSFGTSKTTHSYKIAS